MSRILLAGATGLVGSQVFKNLAEQSANHELDVIARRPLEAVSMNMRQHVADTADWPAQIMRIAPDVAISCLGTTIKTAGSEAAFAAVDLDLVVALATAAKAAGAKQMIVISSVGAMPASNIFYLRTKAEAEHNLRMLGFDRLDIIRPGLLRGNREESRLGERLGILLSPFTDALMHGSLRRYRSIDSAIVANAIANLAGTGGQGTFIHENDAITALAG